MRGSQKFKLLLLRRKPFEISNRNINKMCEYIEQTVCKTNDLQNNEKKVFDLGIGKILLIKQKDGFSALGTKCSHYGAPLINGVLYNNKISCPWHSATFCVSTGDIEDFPGCDSLPIHKVSVKGSDVIVKAKKSDLEGAQKRVKALSTKNSNNVLTFVIVGGGPSGLQCAETLRQEGFTGRVVLITNEDTYPYDRTKLSKALNTKVPEILLRSQDYLNKANIEVLLNTSVNKLDTKEKSVQLNDESTLRYDRIFLGTGVRPKIYEVNGNGLKNICYLRTHSDANFIAENAVNKDVVIIGTSFIGMEVTSFLNGKAKSLTVIGKNKYPFAYSLGQQIGEQIKKLFESKGIKFYSECEVKEFRGINNELKELVLSNDEVLSADLCVIGIGCEPNNDYLKGTDIKMEKSYILVDKHFETSEKNVFAGGDIVKYPLSVLNENMVNVGHWQTAQSHGKFAALSMLGKTNDLKSVPFFWSMFFGKGLRFAGNNQDFKDVIIDGELSELKFIAYYINSAGQVVAVATMANDPIATMFTALLRNGKTLTANEIKTDPKKWIKSMTNGE